MKLKNAPPAILLWVVVLFTASCTITDTEPLIPTYQAEFSIKEGENPLPKATVFLGENMLLTDDNGELVFDNLEAGDYEYSVYALGYENNSGIVEITDSNQTIDIDLAAVFYSMSLTILSPDGEPLEGAEVSLSDSDETQTSNELGEVSFEDVKIGAYAVAISPNEYYYYEKYDTLSVDGEDLSAIVQLEDARIYPSGNGSAEYPFEINHLAQLERLSQTSSEWDLHFILTEDLDASISADFNDGLGFSPIGNDKNYFTGAFDGGTHVIDGLVINRPSGNTVALFGYLSDAAVSNLNLTHVFLNGSSSVGGFAAIIDSNTLIENCSTSGTLSASGMGVGGFVGATTGSSRIVNCQSACTIAQGSSFVGGFAGWNVNSSISLCVATGNVNGRSATGGFVGKNEKNAQIEQSYATGKVYGSSYYTGGFCGSNEESASISNCFSTGDVSTGSYYSGGFCGTNLQSATISNSYSIGEMDGKYYSGGFVGYNDSSSQLESCAYNSHTSGKGSLGIGLDKNHQTSNLSALNTGEFSKEVNFSGWDFSSIWEITYISEINNQNKMPYLQQIQ